MGKPRDELNKKITVVTVVLGQEAAEFYGQVATVIHQAAPEFPSLPPTVVGGIGTEYQQHGNGEAKQVMEQGKILQMAVLGEVEIIHLQVGYPPGIQSHDHHQGEKLSNGVGLVEIKNKSEPVFGIIADHASKIMIREKG